MNNKIVEIAKKELGYAEQKKWTKYGDWYGKKFNNKSFAVSDWCQAFISWCAEQAGIDTSTIPLTASCPIAYRWFKKNDRVVKDVKVGDIIFFTWNGSKNADHVGIVYLVNGNSFTTIEGNKNDKVETRDVRLGNKNIFAICRPDYIITPAPKLVNKNEYIVKRGDTLSSIATTFNTTYQVLASYNKIKNPNIIRVGQVIKIPTKNTVVAIPKTKIYTITAKKGLYVRNKPSLLGKIIGGYSYNRKIVVSEIKNGWARTNEGYVSAKYIK